MRAGATRAYFSGWRRPLLLVVRLPPWGPACFAHALPPQLGGRTVARRSRHSNTFAHAHLQVDHVTPREQDGGAQGSACSLSGAASSAPAPHTLRRHVAAYRQKPAEWGGSGLGARAWGGGVPRGGVAVRCRGGRPRCHVGSTRLRPGRT